MPSEMTRSPGFKPVSTIHMSPTRSASFTVRMAHFVVGVHDRDLIAALQLVHGALWNQQRIFA